MPVIRSISGLRATHDLLTDELIKAYTQAFLSLLPHNQIVIGYDGRPSGAKLNDLITKILVESGIDVIQIGISPTPTVQVITDLHKCSGGIAITASHNSQEWNGLKFINSEGIFLDEFDNKKLWEKLDKGEYNFQNHSKKIGKITVLKDVHRIHINKILNLDFFRADGVIDKIKNRRYRIVVDAVNASGSQYIPELLNSLNCEVIPLYCENTGIFPHNPEPLPIHLGDLMTAVVNYGADFGVAVDPDADRLVLIDNEGNAIGEEKTVVLAIESVLSFMTDFKKLYKYNVVVNSSTTQLAEFVADKYDAKLIRSAVGEINVVKAMKENNAIIGGEGSGGVIFPDSHYGRDSLVGVTLILALLIRKRASLSQLANSYPKYFMEKEKYNFTGDFEILKEIVKEKLAYYEFYEFDGIKGIKDKTWFQLRKSNTEPIIRIIYESNNIQELNRLKSEIKKIVSNLI